MARLSAIRRRRLLSIRELAAVSGVSAKTIHDAERGRISNPRPSTIRRLCDALGVEATDVDEFAGVVGRDEDAPPHQLRFLTATDLEELAMMSGREQYRVLQALPPMERQRLAEALDDVRSGGAHPFTTTTDDLDPVSAIERGGLALRERRRDRPSFLSVVRIA